MPIQSLRIEYGKHLVALGKKYKNIIALEADLKDSTQSVQFQQAYPNRYIEVGVAEQNMVGIAAGLALSGMIPVVHSFACFISMRSCEQVRTTVAYPRLNVKFVVTHAGISTGTAGTTHHSIEDIAIMRAIPNMTVIAPGTISEMKQALEAAIRYKGPVYVRLSASDVQDAFLGKNQFSIGKATLLRNGDEATIITTGTLVSEGLRAADILKNKHGLSVRVLQMACIKPLDFKAVEKAAWETGVIVTAEEHNKLGGLGSAVSEVVSGFGCGKIKRLGIDDAFCEFGSYMYLLGKNKLFANNIVRIVKSMIVDKNKHIKRYPISINVQNRDR